MRANGIRLNQRRRLRINSLRIQQVGDRYGQVFAEAAILMHANHRNLLAAVSAPAQTGRTLLAGHVRNNRHLLTIFQILYIFAQPDNFPTYFMTQYTWIAEKWLIATLCMNIGTANPD